jgi:HD-GYP domain-containing protein (c-di-GMP phosphodiesterase class II)
MSTLILLALVVYRYIGMYRLSRSALVAGFLASSILVMQSQISMVTAPLWHASWWEYHMLLFAAFLAAFTGMAIEYARDGSLHGVVEGLLLRDAISQLQRGYTEVIVALVRAVEAKDVYTRGHTQRVADYSVRIAQEMRLSPEQLRVVSQAAILHDIGKIAIPDSILNKPGTLTPEEYEVVKQHPARGHAIIKDVRSLQLEVPGVRHHHERLDGTGYPDALRGDEIPLVARVIAVADVYDALTSARPYRPAWTQPQALEFLEQEAGRQFDPQCVAALRRAIQAPALSHAASVPEPFAVAVS